MIKRQVKTNGDGLQPPLLLVRSSSSWKPRKIILVSLLSAVAIVVYVEAAYWLLGGLELPAWWQRLLGLAYVLLAVGAYTLATRETESAEDLLHRIRKGQHSDFGKRLRKAQEKRTTVKLPVVGETSRRALGGCAVFVLASLWWLSPWSPVKVKELVVEDLTAPLADELMAVVLVAPDENTAVLQPPVLPNHTRKIAAMIVENKASDYQLGLKAIAEGRFEQARKLLANAMRHDDAQPDQINLARALNEMYAGEFERATAWYDNVVRDDPDDPLILCQTAVAWMQAGEFDKAEPLVSSAVAAARAKPAEDEKKDDSALGVCLHVQAVLNVCLGKKHDDVEATCWQARTIFEETPGDNDPFVAASLNAQAIVYLLRARYPGAEGLDRRAGDAWSRVRGATHPHVAASLCNLAMLQCSLGHYDRSAPAGDDSPESAQQEGAKELLQRALQCQAGTLPETHPAVAFAHNAAAVLQVALERPAEAQPLAEKALAIATDALGPEHPSLAPILDTLATVYVQQARYTKADLYYLRAIAIARESWGPAHPYLAGILNHLAQLHALQGRNEDSELVCQEALDILQKVYGDEHPEVAAALSTRGRLAAARGDSRQARLDFEEALEIRRKAFGKKHRLVARSLGDLASLDNSVRYYTRGVDLYKQAIEMDDALLGLEHPEVARLLYDLAALHARQQKYEAAQLCLQRALSIRETALVPYHPDLAATLDACAAMLRKLSTPDPDRADELAARAEAIRAKHAEEDRPE
ncbi:MAG: tetratricopeptide repeat protein [Pirellulales bacterium]|nr:tetratricopeptide repeat protein [Pirellulales bacterium]